MGFLVSPGVETNEIDLTDIVPSLSTSVGGYAGYFRWGPAGSLVTIGSEKELAKAFGTPSSASNAETSFFTASSFLKYGNNLKVSRALPSDAYNARTGGNGQINSVGTTPVLGSSVYTVYGLPDADTGVIVDAGSPIAPITVGVNPSENAEVQMVLTIGAVVIGGSPAVIGSGFQVGDTIRANIADGVTSVNPVFTVATESGGAITGLTITEAGLFNTTEVVDAIATGTAGAELANLGTTDSILEVLTGAGVIGGSDTVSLSASVDSFVVVDGGNGYLAENQPYVKFTSNSEATTHIYATTLGYNENYSISNQDELIAATDTLNDSAAGVVARYPGAVANGLEVHFVDSAVYADGGFSTSVKSALPFAPSSTVWSEGYADIGSAINDEVHVVVVDGSGDFSGTPGTILEIHPGLSVGSNAQTEYGESNYYVTVVNNNSSYVWLTPEATPTVIATDTGAIDKSFVVAGLTLNGGSTGTLTSAAPVVTALGEFDDAETVDVNLLFAQTFADTGLSGTATFDVDAKLYTIANDRKDLVAFVSAPLTVKDATNNTDKKAAVLAKFAGLGSSSYVVFDSTPGYVYNKYRDAYVWVPLAGHMAGLCANADRIADPWFSPAGLNRGNLLGVVKIAYNPKQAERDDLYQERINPVVSFPGQGIVLFGDKTALSKPSAFDRINVRRLFTTLEKAIATSAKYQLFELNDEFTRATFRNAVEPYLRDVQGRRGISDFRVVCNDSNNTPEVIDGNRFIGDVYIKPNRSINFVTLNFIATRTGVAFEELIGQ